MNPTQPDLIQLSNDTVERGILSIIAAKVGALRSNANHRVLTEQVEQLVHNAEHTIPRLLSASELLQNAAAAHADHITQLAANLTNPVHPIAAITQDVEALFQQHQQLTAPISTVKPATPTTQEAAPFPERNGFHSDETNNTPRAKEDTNEEPPAKPKRRNRRATNGSVEA